MHRVLNSISEGWRVGNRMGGYTGVLPEPKWFEINTGYVKTGGRYHSLYFCFFSIEIITWQKIQSLHPHPLLRTGQVYLFCNLRLSILLCGNPCATWEKGKNIKRSMTCLVLFYDNRPSSHGVSEESSESLESCLQGVWAQEMTAEGLNGWQDFLRGMCSARPAGPSLPMAAVDFKDRHCLGREAHAEACFWKGAGDSLKKDKWRKGQCGKHASLQVKKMVFVAQESWSHFSVSWAVRRPSTRRSLEIASCLPAPLNPWEATAAPSPECSSDLGFNIYWQCDCRPVI